MTRAKDAQMEHQMTTMIRESAHQIWLAGLGAFAKAQHDGLRFFEALVQEGAAIEARDKQAEDQAITVEKMKNPGSWDKMEHVFENRVSRALHHLDIPTRHELQNLSRQVEELSAQVKQLTEAAKQRD